MYPYLLTFISGVIIEATAVFWVHHAERGHMWRTGLFSALQAVSLVVGVGESVHDWHLGAILAVKIKQLMR
jgi:hypothetical protein